MAQLLAYTLIEQNPHSSLCRQELLRFFERGNSHFSRETVGYPSRNSSRVCPLSSESNKSCSGTRVPRNTAVPPRIFGFFTMTLSIAPTDLHRVYHSNLGRTRRLNS